MVVQFVILYVTSFRNKIRAMRPTLPGRRRGMKFADVSDAICKKNVLKIYYYGKGHDLQAER